MVGPGKGIDTDKYFVVCSNIIGSCTGRPGPARPTPPPAGPTAWTFRWSPSATWSRPRRPLIDHLGIEKLLCVIGGSIGGMQVLEWAVRYPEMVRSAIPLATTMRHSALAIAFNEAPRQAIMADPNWNHGDYYGRENARPGPGGGPHDRSHHLSLR